MLVTFDNTPILDRPYIDTLNSLVSHTGYAVVNVSNSPVLRTFSNLPLMLLGGVKSITIVFEHLGEVASSASSVADLRGKPSAPVLRTYSNLPLMLLGGVKSITIVFEHLGEVVSDSS